MKKKFFSIFAAVCAVFALFAVAGCNKGSEKGGGSGNVILNVESVAFTANNDVLTLDETTSLKDYMDALAANGELVFGGENGEYGFFVQSVYSTKAEGNHYWALYTDLTELDGVTYSSAEYGTFECGGKTLYSASYGVSGLPCVAGYTYALVYSSF